MTSRRAKGAEEQSQRPASAQDVIDRRNTKFWDELCGTGLARRLGVATRDKDGLRRFDEGFLGMYPYLESYVPSRLGGQRVLEIGLGYGTLSQMLIERGAEYFGLDIAPGPVAMVSERMRLLGLDPEGHVLAGSVLAMPFDDNSFDRIWTIGCLHHTGNIQQSVEEIYRVLRPGGLAVVMLYNSHGYRHAVRIPAMGARLVLDRLRHRHRSQKASFSEQVRRIYDSNKKGKAAPHTDFTSPRQARRMFRRFDSVKIEKQNFDTLVWFGGRRVITRERLLGNIAHVLGLDLYITARK
jgi:SAM-dependent methyltransferase